MADGVYMVGACMQERRPLKRAICIPLECILVIIVIFRPEFSENIFENLKYVNNDNAIQDMLRHLKFNTYCLSPSYSPG